MLDLHEYELQKLRRDDIRRASEHLNQITEARELAETPARPLYAVALAHVGKLLVEVGTKLETQYGDLVENGTAPSTAG